MTRRNYHGSECGCDTCCNARNARAHKYVALTKQGPKYNEDYETYHSRLNKVCDTVERKYKENN